jgi:retron-type reverse transcriptase
MNIVRVFDPIGNTHQAVLYCKGSMTAGFSWVVEGDVKAFSMKLSHKAILKVVREKVMDNKFLDLICRFLKAGVSVEGVCSAN